MEKIIEEKRIEKDNIVIFNNQDVNLEVNMQDETVWLSQEQMSKLFGKAKSTINEHINNIFSVGELEEDSVIRNFRITAKDGKKYMVKYYNLDMIFYIKMINKL